MLDYEFMRNAYAAAGIVAVVAAMVGYFLVLRGQSFAGHALSHIGFSGATGAALVGLAPLNGMLIAALAGGVCIGLLGERMAQRDVAIGIALSLSLGLGLLFLHFYTAYATQASTLLFGNVLAVSGETVRALLVLGLACLAGLAAISRPLLFASLQPELAQARGVSLRTYSALFMAIAALATVLSTQVVGILLVFSLMVGPPATAQRLTRRVGSGLALSAALALACAWLGIALAYWTDWPCSFWITALSCAAYLAAQAWAWLRGRSAPRSAARP